MILMTAWTSADSNFLNAWAPPFGPASSAIYVMAGVMNASNESQYLPNFNVTASLDGYNNTNTTNGTEPLVLNLTINASLNGQQYITVSDNSSDPQTKLLPFFVTNVANVTFTFTKTLPPFSAGSSFVINLTLNHTNGSLYVNTSVENVSVEIFAANGNETTGWTISNLSASTDGTGTIRYNITIPSTADGQYVLLVDKGAGYLVFLVSSGYTMAVSTQDSNGETKVLFAPGEAASVLAKIRDSSNNPVTGATATAYITLPNTTIVTLSLSQPNTTAFPGFYNASYTTPTTFAGLFSVRVKVTVGTQNLEGFAQFFTKVFVASFQEETDFFDDWGGFRAIVPGGTVAFDLVATNLTDGSIIEGWHGANSNTSVNCTQLGNITIFWAQNNTNYTTTTDSTYTNSTYQSVPVCRVSFTAPSLSGQWLARVNVTIGNSSDNATGLFLTQNYFLKVKPTQTFGGDEFFQIFSPGSNVTFEISSYDLSGDTTVNGSNITQLAVQRVRALAFGNGGTDEENVSYWVSYWGTTGGSPELIVTLPVNTTGPILVEVSANITVNGETGEVILGNSMVLAKYIDGFIEPTQDFGGGDGPQGPPASTCSGVEAFAGTVRDIKTNQNAQGVILNGVKELRDEFTGQDLTGCVTVSSATSNNTGSGQNFGFNVTFADNASCAFSGFYFMILNVTYQGNVDFLPSGFVCKQMASQVTISVNGQQAWQVAPDDNLSVNVSNIKVLETGETVMDGSFKVLRLMNFDPNTGPKFIQVADGVDTNTTISSGSGVYNLTPGNFSIGGVNLTKWPSGFVELHIQICNTTGDVCDAEFNGFEVVAFNAYIPMDGPPGQYYPGQNATLTVMAATNVAPIGNVTVKVGRPWEGQVQTATVNYPNTTNNSDGWNQTGDTGFENWTVNFTIPAGLPKGFQVAMIIVNSSYHNDTVTLYYPLQVTKYQVLIPSQEDVEVWRDELSWLNSTGVDNTGYFNISWLNSSDSGLMVQSKQDNYCVKSWLNSTRWGSGGQTEIAYNNSWSLLMVDNWTSGVYDTIVVNASLANGTWGLFNYTNASSRTIAGNNTLQLWDPKDCGYFRMLSTVAPLSSGNNWGGSQQVGQSFLIPYIVSQASIPITGATIGVSAIILQTDMGGSQGGQGFEQQLTEGVNYTVNQQGSTDVNGFAWLNVTINSSGPMMLFWNLTVGNDTDQASFESGTFVEVRNFDAYGNQIFWMPSHTAEMINASNGSVSCGAGTECLLVNYSGATLNISFQNNNATHWFAGMINETSVTDFLNDSNLSTFFFIWNPTSNQFIIDDDFNMVQGTDTDNYSVTYATLNQTITIQNLTSIQIKAGRFADVDGTPTNSTNFAFYQSSPRPSDSGVLNFQPANSTAPLFGEVCAQDFGNPASPIANANVSVFMQQWTMNGATTTNLTIVDPLNGTQLSGESTLKTSIAGCIGVSVLAPGSGWPSGQGQGPAEVRARIYNGTNTETTWVTMVQYFG